jgi:hypothetical protein
MAASFSSLSFSPIALISSTIASARAPKRPEQCLVGGGGGGVTSAEPGQEQSEKRVAGIFASARGFVTGLDAQRQHLEGVEEPQRLQTQGGTEKGRERHVHSRAEKDLAVLLKTPLRRGGGGGRGQRLEGGVARADTFVGGVSRVSSAGDRGDRSTDRGVRGEAGVEEREREREGAMRGDAVARREVGERDVVRSERDERGRTDNDHHGDDLSMAGLRVRILAAARQLHRDLKSSTSRTSNTEQARGEDVAVTLGTSIGETQTRDTNGQEGGPAPGGHSVGEVSGGQGTEIDEDTKWKRGGAESSGSGRVTAEERARQRLSRHRERATELKERERDLQIASASASSLRRRADQRHIGLL